MSLLNKKKPKNIPKRITQIVMFIYLHKVLNIYSQNCQNKLIVKLRKL